MRRYCCDGYHMRSNCCDGDHIYEEVAQLVQSQEELSVYCQFLSCAEPDSSQTASWATNHIFQPRGLLQYCPGHMTNGISKQGPEVSEGIYTEHHADECTQCFESKLTKSSSALIL